MAARREPARRGASPHEWPAILKSGRAAHPRGSARYLKYCGHILLRAAARRGTYSIASDPYRAWARPFGPAYAERTDVITRGDNRCRGIRGVGRDGRAKERADTINKTSTRQRKGSALMLTEDVLGGNRPDFMCELHDAYRYHSSPPSSPLCPAPRSLSDITSVGRTKVAKWRAWTLFEALLRRKMPSCVLSSLFRCLLIAFAVLAVRNNNCVL